jgi:phosphoglycolate phosphatase-like HAD superfamily hydrolase
MKAEVVNSLSIKLILFDIDGTLVLTGGAGGRAMSRAFERVFGVRDALAGISMNGRTDAWIVSHLAIRHGFSCDPDSLRLFHDTYVSMLKEEVDSPGPRKGIMPGVMPLLDALDSRDDVYLALLTGNFEAGARIKLEYFGLWRYFACGAFGDGAPERNGLLPRALGAVKACGGPEPELSNVVIVGDTPLDVAVALAGGTRSIAVATGGHDEAALEESGADVVLRDLSDLNSVLGAMGLEARKRA